MKTSSQNCVIYPQNGGILKSEVSGFLIFLQSFFGFAKKLFVRKN